MRTSEQTAVYDGKLRETDRIKENLKKIGESNPERQFHNIVYK